MKNICVFTFGGTWEIVPEILGFLNPGRIPLYGNRPDADSMARDRERYRIEPVSEIWLVTTDGSSEALSNLKAWLRSHTGDAIAHK